MSFATRIANVAHKTAVTSVFGFFTWQIYQLGTVVAGRDPIVEKVNPHGAFFEMLRDQYEQEYKKYSDTGHREW